MLISLVITEKFWKILYNRSLSVNDIIADACHTKQGQQDKNDKESKTKEDIDGFTVAELRSALAGRGLSTVGTKKILHSRLLEALNATKSVDSVKDADEDDGKDSDGTY